VGEVEGGGVIWAWAVTVVAKGQPEINNAGLYLNQFFPTALDLNQQIGGLPELQSYQIKCCFVGN
jgi:hypothetical protein